ncbi:MAG TPA: tetratricopeptide repeat protein [Bryobacteraceae bacterium]|jgi:tetratricopeptide (TPR) repeat protein|nr:tetratricopeptide repeat protein [Bryobacteraceae bacterium]
MRSFLILLFVVFAGPAALSQNGNSEDAIRQAYETGDKALRAGNLAQAQTSFESVLRMLPEDVGARINLGVVFMREKKWTQALLYLKEAEKRAPNVTGIRLNIGLAEYHQGDYAAAIPPFESVLREEPASIQARHLLGLSYLFEERYREAATTLEPLWPSSNSNLTYLYSLAVAAGNAGLRDLEERSLARLLEVGKDSPLVHLLKGKAYLAREDFSGAIEEFQIAAQAESRLPLLHYNLGVAYRREGHLDKAREEFLIDSGIEPGVAFDYDQLGEIAYRNQQTKAAESYFRQAVRLDPRLGTSWFGLAKIYKQEKRFPEALDALARAGAIDPNSASVHYLRAQVLTELGRSEEAENELSIVRRLKAAGLDKLEKEVNGPSYHDPEFADHRSE